MVLLIKQMEVSLALLKLLGGFPYKEIRTGPSLPGSSPKKQLPDEAESPSGENVPAYQKSTFLEIATSLVVSLLYVTYLLLIAIEISNGDDDRSSKRGLTYSVADSIEDIVNLGSVLLLGIYFILKRSDASEVIIKFHRLSKKVPLYARITVFSHEFTVCLLLFTSTTVIFVGKKIFSLSSFLSIAIAGETLEIVLNFMWYLFTMGFYHSSMSMIISAYFKIKGDLTAVKSQVNPLGESQESNLMNESKMMSHGDNKRHSLTSDDTKGYANVHELLRTSRDVKALLIEVQDFHRHLHDYIGLPIGVILLSSVFSCVIAVYMMLLGRTLNVFYPVMNILHILLSSLPVCVFANIPNAAQLKVNDLKLLVNSMRRDPEFRPMKGELDELKEMLEESPGFELCHVFTLGRARILDIFSYVATYLVILLQFRSSEIGKWDVCNETIPAA